MEVKIAWALKPQSDLKLTEQLVGAAARELFFAHILCHPDQPFIARIGERHAGSDTPDWLADIIVGDLGDKESLLLESDQFYFASHHYDRRKDYAGIASVVILTDVNAPVSFVTATCHITHASYGKAVYDTFSDWTTLYRDAPIAEEGIRTGKRLNPLPIYTEDQIFDRLFTPDA